MSSGSLIRATVGALSAALLVAATGCLPGFPASTRPSTSTADIQAKALVKEVLAAYGGSEKIRSLNASPSVAKGKFQEISSISGACTSMDCRILTKGEKFRMEVTVMGQPTISGFNGVSGWMQEGDEVTPADPSTSQQMKEEIQHGLILLEKLDDPATELRLGEHKLIQHKNCPSLMVRAADGKFTTLYLHPTKHTVVRSEYQGTDVEQGLGTLKGYEYEDYREIYGTLVPFKTVEFNDLKKCSEVDLSSIVIDDSIQDIAFEMPPEKSMERLKAGPVIIPFEYLANEIIVHARVNDGDPLNFIIDTGATQSILDQSIATTLGINTHTGYSMTTGSGSIKTDFAKLESLTLGDIKLNDITLVVAPMQGFDLPGAKAAGLLGANVLRRFLVSIDYPNRRLILSNPLIVNVPAGAVVLETKPALGASGRIIDGELDGKPLTFLIDTGAAVNNITEAQAKSLLNCPILPVGKIQGLDGQKVDIGSAKFKSLRIDKITIADPLFSIAPQPTVKGQGSIISASNLAILGNPLWSRFKMTVDYRSQRIIVEESKQQSEIDSALGQLKKIQISFLISNDHQKAIASLRALCAQSEHEDATAASALCRAALAFSIGAQASSTNYSNDMLTAHREFDHAQQLADKSKNRDVQAHVRSLRALASLINEKPANYAEARQMITEANSYTTVDAALALALYFLQKQLNRSPKAAAQMLDQALLLEPDNLTALYERYLNAQADKDAQTTSLVLAQLKHYYPDAPGLYSNLSAATDTVRGVTP